MLHGFKHEARFAVFIPRALQGSRMVLSFSEVSQVCLLSLGDFYGRSDIYASIHRIAYPVNA
jgi:hypothetical protein